MSHRVSIRVTRTWPSSGRTRTSAKWAAKAYIAAVLVVGMRMVFTPEANVAKAASSSSGGPARRTTSTRSRPRRRSSAGWSPGGSPGIVSASSSLFSAAAAASTAGPIVPAFRDAPWTGAAGRSVSPSTTRTRAMSTPSASAATWAIRVVVPDPISWVAEATSTLPSASIAARTAAWLR